MSQAPEPIDLERLAREKKILNEKISALKNYLNPDIKRGEAGFDERYHSGGYSEEQQALRQLIGEVFDTAFLDPESELPLRNLVAIINKILSQPETHDFTDVDISIGLNKKRYPWELNNNSALAALCTLIETDNPDHRHLFEYILQFYGYSEQKIQTEKALAILTLYEDRLPSGSASKTKLSELIAHCKHMLTEFSGEKKAAIAQKAIENTAAFLSGELTESKYKEANKGAISEKYTISTKLHESLRKLEKLTKALSQAAVDPSLVEKPESVASTLGHTDTESMNEGSEEHEHTASTPSVGTVGESEKESVAEEAPEVPKDLTPREVFKAKIDDLKTVKPRITLKEDKVELCQNIITSLEALADTDALTEPSEDYLATLDDVIQYVRHALNHPMNEFNNLDKKQQENFLALTDNQELKAITPDLLALYKPLMMSPYQLEQYIAVQESLREALENHPELGAAIEDLKALSRCALYTQPCKWFFLKPDEKELIEAAYKEEVLEPYVNEIFKLYGLKEDMKLDAIKQALNTKLCPEKDPIHPETLTGIGRDHRIVASGELAWLYAYVDNKNNPREVRQAVNRLTHAFSDVLLNGSNKEKEDVKVEIEHTKQFLLGNIGLEDYQAHAEKAKGAPSKLMQTVGVLMIALGITVLALGISTGVSVVGGLGIAAGLHLFSKYAKPRGPSLEMQNLAAEKTPTEGDKQSKPQGEEGNSPDAGGPEDSSLSKGP